MVFEIHLFLHRHHYGWLHYVEKDPFHRGVYFISDISLMSSNI